MIPTGSASGPPGEDWEGVRSEPGPGDGTTRAPAGLRLHECSGNAIPIAAAVWSDPVGKHSADA